MRKNFKRFYYTREWVKRIQRENRGILIEKLVKIKKRACILIKSPANVVFLKPETLNNYFVAMSSSYRG